MSFRHRQTSRRALPSDFGGFSPASIGAGTLNLWLRADLANVHLTSGNVDTWTDKSGAGNTVANGTGAQQPLWVASAQNGKPCARFASASSQVLSKSSANLFGSGAYSVAMTVKCADSGAEKGLFADRDSPGAGGIVLEKNASNQRDDIHIGVALHTDSVMGTSPEIWTVTRAAGAAPLLWINGVSTAIGASTGLNDPGASAVLSVGAYFSGGAFTAFSDSDIYEVIAYSSSLSASDRRRIEIYMGARYAIAV